MKIALDATPIGIQTPDRGGVYRYVWQLVEALARIDPENEYRLFFDFFRRHHLAALAATTAKLQVGPNFQARRAKIPPSLSSRFGVPVEWQLGAVDVFHGTYDQLPRTLKAARVVTLHDVRYLDPDLESIGNAESPGAGEEEKWRADRENRRRLFARLRETIAETIRSADELITVSEFSKRQLVSALGAPAEKIQVIYHGLDPRFRPQAAADIAGLRGRLNLPERYLLHVSKFDPLKNIERLLTAFAALDAPGVGLVLSGPENWYAQVIRRRVAELGLAERVIFPGFVEDADLPTLYSGAEAFVLPTLYEGFGLPVIEAMACGAPVITSNTTAMPEIAGGAALLVNPESVPEITAAMGALLGEPARRSSWRAKGLERSAGFTWERCAEQTLAVYRSAGAKKRVGRGAATTATTATNGARHSSPEPAGRVLIFAHQPKTGGATLRKLMERYYPVETTFVIHDINPLTVEQSINKLRALPEADRRRITAVTGHAPLGLHRFLPQPATYITLLRNPVERTLSHMGNVMRHQRDWSAADVRNWGQDEFVASGGKPEAFLDWMEKFGLDNLQTRCLLEPSASEWDHLAQPRPMPPDALERAKQALAERFAVVGIMERYDETLLLIKKRLGWKNVYYLKTNITPGRKSRREISDSVLAMIHERNALDAELWEFAGKLLEAAVAKEGPAFATELGDYQRWNDRYAAMRQFADGAKQTIRLRTRMKGLLALGKR